MPPRKKVKGTSYFLDRDIVTIDSLDDKDAVFRLFDLADELRNKDSSRITEVCSGKIVALAFMEPSTRTSCSFSAAAQRLGAGVINVNSQDSSVVKGETLSDTMICLASYANLVVLRHPRKGAAQEAADAISVPLINAGDGTGEHPSQALLDVYTILRERNGIKPTEENKLNVTFLGDAKNGRTIHSLSKLLAKLMKNMVRIRYVTPEVEDLKMPSELVEKLKDSVEQSEHTELTDEILKVTDILYVTRVQKERFADPEAYERAMKGSFRVNETVLSKMKPNAVVLHPLPRVDEISTEVDKDPRCAYFRQMENGMYIRMAIIASILGCLE